MVWTPHPAKATGCDGVKEHRVRNASGGYAGRGIFDTFDCVYLPRDYLPYLVGVFDIYLCDGVVLARHGVDTDHAVYLADAFDSRKDGVDLAPYQYEGSHANRTRTPSI